MDYLDLIKNGTLYRLFYNHKGTFEEWDEKVAKTIKDIHRRNRHGKKTNN